MLPRGRGTILFTGATASVRGGSGFCAFAGAKHALRALAQSMARELGPQGLHVAHVVIDGLIDTPFIAQTFPERYALKDRDGILDPEHIAKSYWQIHRQPRSTWTHEMDLRPWMEPFDGSHALPGAGGGTFAKQSGIIGFPERHSFARRWL